MTRRGPLEKRGLALLPAALGAVFCLGVASGPAIAAPPEKPRIDKVNPESALPGGTVELQGDNFGKVVKDVIVLVGGQTSYAQLCEPTRMSIAIPLGLKKGKVPIEVKVAGQSANKVEITILDEKDREQKAKEDTEKESTGGGPQRAKVIVLEPPSAGVDRGVTVIPVTGRAEGLLNGCIIRLRLTLGGSEQIDTTTATVANGRFEGKFGPYQRAFFADTYWVEAMFDIKDQSWKLRQLFNAQYKDPKERAKYEIGTDRQSFQVGVFGQSEEQLKELRGHVSGAVTHLRARLKELESAYGAAGRSAFKDDEAGWEDWLSKKALKTVPEADRDRRIRELKDRKEFLTSSGGFADAKWREWVDAKRSEIEGLAKAHAEYRDRFFYLRHGDVLVKLSEAYDYLLRLSRFRSRELYQLNGQPYAAQDPDTPAVSGSQLESTLGSIERQAEALKEAPKGK